MESGGEIVEAGRAGKKAADLGLGAGLEFFRNMALGMLVGRPPVGARRLLMQYLLEKIYLWRQCEKKASPALTVEKLSTMRLLSGGPVVGAGGEAL